MKKIYLIRHAESEANAAIDPDSTTKYFDARITSKGEQQAQNKHLELKDVEFDLYVCSPLTRTMETFSIIFPNIKPILVDCIREHSFHSCDVGRQPLELKKDFPNFDFSDLKDYWWNNNEVIDEKQIIKETHLDTEVRFDKFKYWLSSRNEKNIAVVSHGMFLSQITGEMLDNCGHYVWRYK